MLRNLPTCRDDVNGIVDAGTAPQSQRPAIGNFDGDTLEDVLLELHGAAKTQP